MLSPRLKEAIRTTYRQLADALPGFVPRREQNFLVAEIAKTLSGEYDKSRRILVAEAGTGIGKSLSYAQGAIPLARLLQKKLIISTATVALQEQLIHKDLPFFLQHSAVPFRFMLVKGRQRYCCEHLLEQGAMGTEESNLEFAFEQLSSIRPSEEDKQLYKRLWDRYTDGKWDGDRDNWPEPIPDTAWERIAADRHTCNKALSHHQQCPFHRARDKMDECHVLVVNHALLLSDLTMGGGIILPPPDECFYVLDEAHHLPNVARDHGAAAVHLSGTRKTLEKLAQSAGKIGRRLNKESLLDPQLKLQDALASLLPDLKAVEQWVKQHPELFGTESHHRFVDGELPEPLPLLAINLREGSKQALRALDRLQGAITEALREGEIRRKEAEPLLAEAGFFLQRLEHFNQLWELMSREVSPGKTPLARWLYQSDTGEVMVHASPIEVGYLLEEWIWSKCLGAVLVSATLTALSSFDYFRHQAGLKPHDGTRYLRLRSPFDYDKAQLLIPKMRCEPSDPGFTGELIERLPELLKGQKASLLLFSSYRQMKEVAEGLRDQGLTLLVQGEASRNALLTLHRQRCDAGTPSILLGTGSFSEGLDLPGHYLTNLIITKLPFAVPNSPVEEATAEWIEKRGGNPFLQVTVPEASRKLIQACGRLIRKEADTGRVTILDRRLVTKRYGKGLLDALPPFKRHIE
ncbi:ATP-dependent DNA helicase DinG [Aeromonas diversa]|uniref:ATP-dependent DNA helicase DinG n=1 Tax=Aeromonas diversa TaxID=502790 RepID=UPI0039A1A796